LGGRIYYINSREGRGKRRKRREERKKKKQEKREKREMINQDHRIIGKGLAFGHMVHK